MSPPPPDNSNPNPPLPDIDVPQSDDGIHVRALLQRQEDKPSNILLTLQIHPPAGGNRAWDDCHVAGNCCCLP